MSKSGLGRRWALGACALLLLLGLGRTATADEGLWLPGQMSDLDHVHLRSLGLELGPRQLGLGSTGLLRAVVRLDDCSGALVSRSGLVLTAYHCIEDALRAAHQSDRDYLETGLLARKPADELPMPGSSVEVLEDISDVTSDILSTARSARDDASREQAIELASTKLVARCERRHPGRRCRVARLFLGKEFKLLQLSVLGDVRVVYAPPAGLAGFGGSVDDGRWPRHSGDFAVVRAYVDKEGKPAAFAKDNVPFKPPQWLHLGDEGIEPGDFVAVLGYPARTQRYLPAAELSRYADQVLPARTGLYGEWVDSMAHEATRSPSVSARISAHRQELERRLEATRRLIEAFKELHLVERSGIRQRRLDAWCADKPARKPYAEALDVLAKLSAARRARFSRALIIDSLDQGPDLLAVAVDLVRRARARRDAALPDAAYNDNNAKRLWRLQAARLARFDAQVDAELLASLVLRARALPAGQRIPALADLAGALDGKQRAALVRKLAARIRASRLSDAKVARQLFEHADAAALDKNRDPMIALARGLLAAIGKLDDERLRERGAEARVAGAYFDMLRRTQSGPVYPDADGTLRFSYGSVAGYEPEDGLRADPQTKLTGAIDKSTGERPFSLPRRLLDKAPNAATSYWADPDLGDLPVCFLTNADTDEGNAGGPVIDGRGHVVGVDFDRVRDGVAAKLSYNVHRSREIAVDIRYMLWLLDRVEDAGDLLRELGAAEYRSAPSRRIRAAAPRLHGPRVRKTRAHSNDCDCTVPGGAGDATAPWWLALSAMMLAHRRKRR